MCHPFSWLVLFLSAKRGLITFSLFFGGIQKSCSVTQCYLLTSFTSVMLTGLCHHKQMSCSTAAFLSIWYWAEWRFSAVVVKAFRFMVSITLTNMVLKLYFGFRKIVSTKFQWDYFKCSSSPRMHIRTLWFPDIKPINRKCAPIS